jgi:ABC-type maltose transport system permease subunit
MPRAGPADPWWAGRHTAPATRMTIPVAVMFFIFQRRIISGSLEGAVKE